MNYDSGEISITQRHDIITFAPKKDKDILELKNWRPISLLNKDSKLTAKCIASKIKPYNLNLIYKDQTGFIKGRCIRKKHQSGTVHHGRSRAVGHSISDDHDRL